MTTIRALPQNRIRQNVPRLPDPPEREIDEVTQYDQLFRMGSSRYLAIHLGDLETTLVETDRWLVPHPGYGPRGRLNPDLLISFDADHELYRANNGYIVSEQGKPPDFVLEVASVSTASRDLGVKREGYEEMGIPEYWRFDEAGEYYGVRLAGDRLVDGRYEPIEIERLDGDILEGYSEVLKIALRWESGELRWWDPAIGSYIATFEDERDARIAAESREAAERDARIAAERELARLRGQPPR